MDGDQSDHNKIGYRKPPERTRFRKGQSGNPKGRPVKARTLSEMVEKVLAKDLRIKEEGKTKKISLLEAVVLQLGRKAASGDNRSIQLLLEVQKAIEKQKGEGCSHVDARGRINVKFLQQIVQKTTGEN